MKTISIIIILTLLANFSFGQEFTDLYGDYLGQTPPGDTAVIFAPDIISLPNRRETKITFSPDGKECFFVINIRTEGFKTYYTKRVNDTWTKPVKAPFLNLSAKVTCISANGNRLYASFNSGINRDIFMFERNLEGWGEPQRLPAPINSDFLDQSYSRTADGIAYFMSGRPGGESEYNIWRFNPSSEKAESLGPNINVAGSAISGSYVAPDGSFLIFASEGRSEMIGKQDLFICFSLGNNNWSEPINMKQDGVGVNIGNRHTQNSPTLSHDGKYLFFSRHNYAGTKQDIFWVSTNIIQKLKDEYEKNKCSSQQK